MFRRFEVDNSFSVLNAMCNISVILEFKISCAPPYLFWEILLGAYDINARLRFNIA